MWVMSSQPNLSASTLDSQSEGMQRMKGAGCILRTQTSNESTSACALPRNGHSNHATIPMWMDLESGVHIKVRRGLGRAF